MREALSVVIRALGGIGVLGNTLLFIYYEWLFIRRSFIEFLNPFLQVKVILTILTIPVFWILLFLAIGGSWLAERLSKDEAASTRETPDEEE